MPRPGTPSSAAVNDRKIAITSTDWVKNGDRWRVNTTLQSGALEVTHLRTGRTVTLPARYVRGNVTLGYATTVHGAQGITADTCHTVGNGQESRQLLYVAMTRGRHANHLYLTTAGDGDPHSIITRDALLPPTAGDILARSAAARRRRPSRRPPPNSGSRTQPAACRQSPTATTTRSPPRPRTVSASNVWPRSTPPPTASSRASPDARPTRRCVPTSPCWSSTAMTRPAS